MKFKEVGDRTLVDREFRLELSEAALKARQQGVGSAAWKRLAEYFAESHDELRLLVPPTRIVSPGVVETTTLTTLIVLSDTITGTTTTDTTTTTSRLCSLPGICQRRAARGANKKGKAKSGTKKRK